MRTPRRIPLTTLVVALGLAASGCGGNSTSSGSSETTALTATTQPTTTTTPAIPPARAGVPRAVFSFERDGTLQPAQRTVAHAATIELVGVSADGRPHAFVLSAPGRPRLLVPPGHAAVLTLRGLPRGRYRVEPIGAVNPVRLRVR